MKTSLANTFIVYCVSFHMRLFCVDRNEKNHKKCSVKLQDIEIFFIYLHRTIIILPNLYYSVSLLREQAGCPRRAVYGFNQQ